MSVIPVPVLSDGILPTGSFEATILESGLTYILDNFNWDRKSTLVRRKTASGRPGSQKAIGEFVDGSCDIQLADESTPTPDEGMAFLIDANKDGVAEPYMVVNPGRTFTQDGEYKSKLTIARFANPCITASGSKTTDQLYAGISLASTVAITAINLAAALPPDLTLDASPWSAVGLPAGLTIAAATGIITGTPTTPGVNYMQVKVTATRTFLRNGAVVTEHLTGKREFVCTIT